MPPLQTHDPARLSWIESANTPIADFPLQNLPYGVFVTAVDQTERLGVAIGDQVLDLRAAAKAGLLPAQTAAVCQQPNLNPLMALGAPAWAELRAGLSELLGASSCPAPLRAKVRGCLVPQTGATMRLPAQIGGYTDFYASIHHATNVGALFRPDQPLLPNYKWVPIGYHGRSSSIVVSGTPVRRPSGQAKSAESSAPIFGPSQSLDYELELGAFVGPGNRLGETIPLEEAAGHLFGVVLLNDWSARDIQSWEYQPLGPFLAKNFATTISPWVVTLEALAPFRVPAFTRPSGDPAPLSYLADAGDAAHGGLDLTLEAWLTTARMRAAGQPAHRLSSGNFREMYWTLAQLLGHHASNGCNLRPGDLLGSGTVSGPTRDSLGCLLELTRRGAEPLRLPGGEERGFLQDGDEVILRGFAERAGFRRIGLGECRGVVLPATA
ncbi:fumarylacetoacetase [Opitutus sp. GAS368]|uniref:fumarylacetoacetase n=1 Tax=Opitutus sp. GAS368 TaxID=1882749 RepID=UPI00087B6060|nr:fumarylacetoacetase [Opitutus sp. GAS368]SDR88605.1 fumarylacetoacetate hydrolase [Opitutus sp. GAS368]